MSSTKSFFLVSPVGVADYPYLNKPDTKFNATGVYHCKLVLDYDDAEAQEFTSKLAEAADAEYQAAVKAANGKRVKQADAPFYVAEYQGRQAFIVKAKLNASGVNSKTKQPFTQAPRLFNADGSQLGENDLIFSGSKVRLNIEVVPFTSASIGSGVSLRLRDVLVVERSKGNNAGGSPFDSFFTAKPNKQANPFGGGAAGSDDGGDY